jgi:hypothetical protein
MKRRWEKSSRLEVVREKKVGRKRGVEVKCLSSRERAMVPLVEGTGSGRGKRHPAQMS